MAAVPSDDDLAQFKGLVASLGEAWNRADGAGFAAAFTDDADFVNILGMRVRTRQAIAAGHQQIFDTIYKASHADFTLAMSRLLADGVAVAHIEATLDAPGGPRPGRTNALATAVLTRGDEGWRIAAFHNTVVAPPPG
jgi:uncharacterized protein (TIGR02246 family)